MTDVFEIGRLYSNEEIYGSLEVGNAGGVRANIGPGGNVERMVIMSSAAAGGGGPPVWPIPWFCIKNGAYWVKMVPFKKIAARFYATHSGEEPRRRLRWHVCGRLAKN